MKRPLALLAFALITSPAFCQGDLHAYLGSLHDHTSDGGDDGKGTVADALAAAKSAGFAFAGVSPHNHMISGQTYRAFAAQMEAANQPGRFVTFPAFEWGVISKGGHAGVVGAPGLFAAQAPDWNAFWSEVAATPDAFVILNHPVWGHTYGGLAADRVARAPLMEVEGGPGEYAGPANQGKPEPSYREWAQAQNQGWRCGVAYGEDNHSGRWGTVNRTRTGVWARELTRPALTEALKSRCTFVTEDPAMTVWIEAGGTPMGGEAPAGPATLSVKVAHASEAITDVAVYVDPDGPGGKMAGEVARLQTGTFSAPVNPTGPGAYAYVIARDASGDLAWSSPIWFGHSDRVALGPEDQRADLNFASPAELDRVDGVGRGTVKLIMQARRAGRVFTKAEEIASVPGIAPELAAKIAAGFRISTPDGTVDALLAAMSDQSGLMSDDGSRAIAKEQAERAERLLALQLAPLSVDAIRTVLARLDSQLPLKILKQSALDAGWGAKLESALPK